MADITSLSNNQFNYFNNLTSNRIQVRVKFKDDQVTYDADTTIEADTDLNPDLAGKTVAELKELCSNETNFQLGEERSVYRYAGGTTAEQLVIPLAKVNKATIVGAIGILTEAFGGTQSFSVGIPGNEDFILGSVVGTDTAFPTGVTRSLWTQNFPFDSAAPDAGGVAPGRVYSNPNRTLAPGTPINLYVTVGTSISIGTGDVTFEFLATSLGQETFGDTEALGRNKTDSGRMDARWGKDLGPIYPIF